MTGLIDFSTDAASNDTGAPPILFAEGQPANTYNNSARAFMAALACWHADTTGSLQAIGAAANTLAISTNQIVKPATFARSFEIAFTVDALNTGPCTLALDGLPARPLRRSTLQDLAPGDLRPGPVYRAARRVGSDQFVLVSPDLDEPGRISAFGSLTAIPSGWVPCDGGAVSRADFAALFAAIGTTFGAGDTATTFNVPDLRGRAAFGMDAGANRLSGNGGIAGTLGSSGGVEAIGLSLDQLPPHNHGGSTGDGGAVAAGTTGAAGSHDHGASTGNGGGHNHTGQTGNAGGHTHSGTASAVQDHNHSTTTASGKNGLAGSGGQISQLWYGADVSLNSGGAGGHSHSLAIDAVTDHSHAFATSAAPDHTHPITAAPNHTHATPATPAHSHAIAMAGAGAGHPNMPPGLVVVFAIKA